MPSVTILIGSKSDLPVAHKAMDVLTMFGISHEVRVASAHRSLAQVQRLVQESDARLFVGVAGAAAALPGLIAALTTRPVIGVPVGGRVPYDSLLSIVQMPPGTPVATVAVDGGENAGYLAAQMLGLQDPTLADKVEAQRAKMAELVLADDRGVQTLEA